MEITKEKQAIYLLGMLSYNFDEIENAFKILDENDFDDIKNFYYDLKLYNIKNKICATISLAGMHSKLKFKDANEEQINDICNLMDKHNITL